MKVVFYGRLAEAIAPAIELNVATCSVRELRQKLAGIHPHAAATLASKRARACIDNSIVGEDHLICSSDDIEFLPPLSGG